MKKAISFVQNFMEKWWLWVAVVASVAMIAFAKCIPPESNYAPLVVVLPIILLVLAVVAMAQLVASDWKRRKTP